MLTQEDFNSKYVDGPEAAKMLNITPSQVRFLCKNRKFKGVIKLGTSGWIIPRESVQYYKPRKPGPKPKKNTSELIATTLATLQEQEATIDDQ